MHDRHDQHNGTALARSVLNLVRTLWVFALVLAPQRALAIDVWTEPNPGIRHLHRTTPAPAEFHALVIDLDAPGVAIRCTPPRERWKSTSAYARDANLAASINGGFWGLFGQGAQGLAAGGGQIWSIDDERHGFFAVTAEGRAWISTPADVVAPNRRRMMEAVSGRPLIVDHGRIAAELWTFPGINSLEPRSVVGVSENGRRVIFATVDGRRVTSHGGRLGEMADLLIELGAWRGVNLDGGGSTTLFVAAEGGVINRPSRGWEREVVNHIGVVAPAPIAPAAATQRTVETPPEVIARAQETRAHTPVATEAPPRVGSREWFRGRFGRYMVIDKLHLGRHREVVVPALYAAALLALLSAVFWAVSRVRRARFRRSLTRKSEASAQELHPRTSAP